MNKFSMLDFFAGSGLVSSAMSPYFETIWANDICPKKERVFRENSPDKPFILKDIQLISGKDVPKAFLSWASFPCVDLSLAGAQKGLKAKKSGLFYDWLRITTEMNNPPPVLVIENVEGLITSKEGINYKNLHRSLNRAGYKAGPLIINAAHWVPQSRVRSFVIAVKKGIDTSTFEDSATLSTFHTKSLIKATQGLKDVIWWSLPKPKERKQRLIDLIEKDAPVFDSDKNKYILSLIPPAHYEKLMSLSGEVAVAPGYRRTRNGKQVLELRFDGLAGCLRVPRGGSSRQYLILKKGKKLTSRLLTTRETARLMGAPSSFSLPGSYNEGYGAMGDAVAFPVVDFLASNLLSPLAKEISSHNSPLYLQ